ncbi:MAG: hypothetical protein RL065_1837 [Bacteroidota bacterium]
MKRNLLLFATLVLSISLKASAQTPVKKVILEDFTGTWCGWCPEGTVLLEGLESSKPTTFFAVASHNGDGLQVPEGAAIDAALSVSSYPNGAVDRFKFPANSTIPMGRGSWNNMVTTRLASTPIASVSFSNQFFDPNTDSFFVDLNVVFVSNPNTAVPLTMNVYLLEDSIPATGNNIQHNYSTSIQAGSDPLNNWYHNNTLRKGLGGNWGFTTIIPSSPTLNTTYSKKVGFLLKSSWVAKNIHLVGFVAYNGTAANNELEILNSERIDLNLFYPLGVSKIENKTANILSIFPNPVLSNQLLNITYSLNENSNISLGIYNAQGQLICQPYNNIYDIKGTHTLSFYPSKFALSKGFYFINISDNKGLITTQKFIID